MLLVLTVASTVPYVCIFRRVSVILYEVLQDNKVTHFVWCVSLFFCQERWMVSWVEFDLFLGAEFRSFFLSLFLWNLQENCGPEMPFSLGTSDGFLDDGCVGRDCRKPVMDHHIPGGYILQSEWKPAVLVFCCCWRFFLFGVCLVFSTCSATAWLD